MLRRKFLKATGISSFGILAGLPFASADREMYSKMKISKIRYYSATGYTKPFFNQARGIVEIETDSGLTGIGEGGSTEMIAQCAQMMIGQDPFRIEYIW